MTSLRDPLTLPCGLVLPNRIMKAALSEGMADKRKAPDIRMERLYTTWGKGGYGLILTGNVMVDGSQLGEPGNVVIEDERNLDALSRWAKATKDGGVPIWVQLNHPGRQSNPLDLGHTPVAPSAVPVGIPGSPTPRELTPAEIEDIIERFATSAAVCEAAGFDGVQIHGFRWRSAAASARVPPWKQRSTPANAMSSPSAGPPSPPRMPLTHSFAGAPSP